MKLVIAASISTAFVVVVGFLIISPMFFRTTSSEVEQQVMLSFSILESENNVDWCKNISRILKTFDISATIFFVGKVAEQHPECVSIFDSKFDIGSQTFSNSNLTTVADYSMQLEEIRNGKLAVDAAGNLCSRVFRAPNGETDQNIYSLLSRSDILADFSYDQQYNVYVDNQFIKFEAIAFNGAEVTANSILALEKTEQPIIIRFDSDYSTELIANFIETLKTAGFNFANASEITGINLTVRGER